MALPHRPRVSALSATGAPPLRLKAAIAGASGAIGSALLQELLKRGWEVVTEGAVDLAIVCIGVAHPFVAAEDASAETWRAAFEGNATAPALAAAAFAKAGAKHILFLSTLAIHRPPIPGTAPYSASKAALEQIVKALAEENWPRTRVNAIALGPVRTRLHDVAGTPREVQQQFPTPQEIAPLILKFAEFEGSAKIFDSEGSAAEILHEPDAEAEPGRRPSPRVLRAIRESASKVASYPRGAGELAERLGKLHGVPRECVALSGGGATELIERSLRAFCEPNDEVLSPFPTYEVLSALCSRQNVRHKPVPVKQHLSLLGAIGPRTRLLYIASPDNPTGAVLSDADREQLEQRGLLLVDEAWSLAEPRPPGNSIVLKSFSKLHGLAGLRIAYAVGPQPLIEPLRKLELPYPLGAPQLAAANAALDEPQRYRRAALLIERERARIVHELQSLQIQVNGAAPMLLLKDARMGKLLFALRAANLPAQEAHWDAQTLILALGRRAQNDRALSIIRRTVFE